MIGPLHCILNSCIIFLYGIFFGNLVKAIWPLKSDLIPSRHFCSKCIVNLKAWAIVEEFLILNFWDVSMSWLIISFKKAWFLFPVCRLKQQNMTTKDAYQYFVLKAQEIAISKNWTPVNWYVLDYVKKFIIIILLLAFSLCIGLHGKFAGCFFSSYAQSVLG